MGSEIERIVDRKPIRGRVHYLVVWRGFSEENNTWESRMDLVADGYSNVIREYENSRKDSDHDGVSESARSPSRGRSPRRSKSPARKSSTTASAKSPAKSPTAARSRGRSRSNSTSGRSPSVTRGKSSRRRSSSKSRDTSAASGTDTESSTPSRRRSSRHQEKMEGAQTMTAKQAEAGDEALRTTLAALDHPQKDVTPQLIAENGVDKTKKTTAMELSYEETITASSSSSIVKETTSASSPKKPKQIGSEDADAAPGFQDLWTKLNEGNWLLWFISAVVIAASLLASQLVPDDAQDDNGGVAPASGDLESAQALSGQWRLWLPFLTPIVALLLVLHQRDERALVKWIAVALSWRIAAELSLFFEFEQIAIGAVAVSYTALVVALVSIARSDDARSKSTLVLFVSGALTLALSDSWIVQTQNVVLASRVNLMSASALAIALSPVLTATTEED